MPGIPRENDYVYFACQGRAALEKMIVFGFKLGGDPQNLFR
jgi:hypothetical protein